MHFAVIRLVNSEGILELVARALQRESTQNNILSMRLNFPISSDSFLLVLSRLKIAPIELSGRCC